MASIRKRDSKWQVQIRRKGQASITRSFRQRPDAVAWAHQMEVQADRHDLPVDRSCLETTTLAQLVERYRDTVTPAKKRCETETIVLNAILRHPICRKTLREIGTTDFAAYRDERLKSIKPTSLKRDLGTIRNVFEVARKEWGLPIRENPIDGLGFKAPDQRRERRLRDGEWDRLLAAAQSCRNRHIEPIIVLAVETGMRRSEILGVRREHHDTARRSLLIPTSKNGRARTIPLSARAHKLLDELPQKEGRLFPISANAFRLAWERAKVRATIHDLHFHDLRHEAISRFFEKGLTMPEVALVSGHRDFRMLFRYAHAVREGIASKLA